MFKSVLNEFGTNLVEVTQDTGQRGASILHLQGVKSYVVLVSNLRRIAIYLCINIFCTVLAAFGLSLLGLAVAFSGNSWTIFSGEVGLVGALLFVCSIIPLFVLNTEKNWMRASGIFKMIDRAETRIQRENRKLTYVPH